MVFMKKKPFCASKNTIFKEISSAFSDRLPAQLSKSFPSLSSAQFFPQLSSAQVKAQEAKINLYSPFIRSEFAQSESE